MTDRLKSILNNKWPVYIYCLLISFIFLFIFTQSSPLYPMNEWVDMNTFFTIGKGMANGLVVYRDVWDWKGPYLFLIYAMSYLVSNDSYLGVFLFQVLSFSVFLYFSHKVSSIYIKKSSSLIITPLLAFTIINTFAYCTGGSCEEFALPLLMISLYYLLYYFKNDCLKFIGYKVLLINGIIAGIILWMKFSFLGFWFAWMMSLLIIMISKKQIVLAIKSGLVFLGGMLIATIPWIIYFGIHGAMYQWIDDYIIKLLTGYAEKLTVSERLIFVLKRGLSNCSLEPVFGVLSIWGLANFVFTNRYLNTRIKRISFASTFVLLLCSVYIGGKGFFYYALILTPFALPGLIVLMDMFLENRLLALSNKKLSIVLSGLVILAILISLPINKNMYMLGKKKEDLVQYKLASVINKTPNATLFYYDTQDSGVMMAANIIPSVKYFSNADSMAYDMNSVSEPCYEQNRYIREKVTDYIITKDYIDIKNENVNDIVNRMKDTDILKYYELVSYETEYCGEWGFSDNMISLLFKKKP